MRNCPHFYRWSKKPNDDVSPNENRKEKTNYLRNENFQRFVANNAAGTSVVGFFMFNVSFCLLAIPISRAAEPVINIYRPKTKRYSSSLINDRDLRNFYFVNGPSNNLRGKFSSLFTRR